MENTKKILVNRGKEEIVTEKGNAYFCYALQTKVVTNKDNISDIILKYVSPIFKEGDILFISEKMVACTQGKAKTMTEIVPSPIAKFLGRYVTKSPFGIGLGIPETMQCAIDECGLIRILFASCFGLIGKWLGKKGWFYYIAGKKASSVDGPCNNTIPPYNHCVVPAPDRPNRVAKQISSQLNGSKVLIVDCNDLGGNIIGQSHHNINRNFYMALLRQNPLGQSLVKRDSILFIPISAHSWNKSYLLLF